MSDTTISLEVTARKKPVTIKAVNINLLCCAYYGTHGHSPAEIPAWAMAAIKDGTLVLDNGDAKINTAEGLMQGQWYDMLIQGVKGELYACNPDIFNATYDIIEP